MKKHDIVKLLQKYKPKIDKEIERIIPRKITKNWLELTLGKADYAYDARTLTNELSKPIWDFLDRGGKRWRPVLLVLCCKAVGGKEKEAIKFTPLPELVHEGTIVADDVEDSAEIRRGKACMHKLFGLDTAINNSNTMYFLPSFLIYRNLEKLGEKKRLAIYDLFCEEMLRVSIGQAMDIHWHKGKRLDITERQYLQMCAYKTGVLARLSARLGAILGNGTKNQINCLGKFGESIGIAFQIQDDIMNLTQAKNVGKEIGEDISEGKRTLLVLYALKMLGKKEGKRLTEILNKHTKNKMEIKEAIELIKKSGAIEYAKGKAKRIVEESWQRVGRVLPKSEAKEKLKAFGNFLIEREF